VAADAHPIKIYDTEVIHRLEVQNGSFPAIKGDGERPSVTYGLVDSDTLLQSGKFGFRGEGHYD